VSAPSVDAARDDPQHVLAESGAVPSSVQPGGGLCVDLEAAWGRLRRGLLRRLRPGYVRRMAARRQGDCPGCPHDIVDPRDLKLVRNVCGHWFRAEDDRFRWRERLGLARYGLAEVVLAGLGFAVLGVVAALGARLGGHPAWWLLLAPGAAVLGFALWFFRDPRRAPPPDPRALVSPADGVVTHVDQAEAPGLPGGQANRISIYLSPWDVHLSRMPRRARVISARYFRGEFLNARHRECVKRNEQMWIDLEEPCGRRLRVKQISGALARRLVFWLRDGEEAAVGERFGLIKFGSRADVLVPIGEPIEVCVAVGDVVRAGTSTLLRFREGTS
jgi:phosphatidylserine decarboxylase